MKNVQLRPLSVEEKRGGACHSYIITVDGAEVGECNLRLDDPLTPYGGNVGYRIEPDFRGHRYSLAALNLLKNEAVRLGLDRLVVCTSPDNAPSRRIAELGGGVLDEVVDIPPDCELYAYGRRRTCRYIIELKGKTP